MVGSLFSGYWFKGEILGRDDDLLRCSGGGALVIAAGCWISVACLKARIEIPCRARREDWTKGRLLFGHRSSQDESRRFL
jgi:hypothetical protein